ncbi:MAG: nickel pincer cofactor biosynthesis protein LarB [Kofleriaceae bacterium]|nr:nickel pincer cofactor biosynthesis protein LarB [Kofleriaceae bacterium]
MLLKPVDRSLLLPLLQRVAEGKTSVAEAELSLSAAGIQVAHADGESVLDVTRTARTGIPEVVFGSHKSASQIVELMTILAANGAGALATRVDPDKARAVLAALPNAQHNKLANLMWLPATAAAPAATPCGKICVVCAGTSDLPVAEEAALTAEFLGATVVRISDVGVAGLGRLLARVDTIRAADVVIVVAGMEGALPSVLAGLINLPMLAVPTSVGYGLSYGGFAALLSMMSSCAPGISVVNIDNGFGAAVAAVRIARLAAHMPSST